MAEAQSGTYHGVTVLWISDTGYTHWDGSRQDHVCIPVDELIRLAASDVKMNDFARDMRHWANENAITYRAEQEEYERQQEEEERQRIEYNREQRQKAKEQPTQRKRPGDIYLIRADTGLYKVGMSKNALHRYTDLAVKLPVRLELIGYYRVDDRVTEEQRWHGLFADKRIVDGGEWFSLDNNDVALFMQEKQKQEQGQ